MGFFSKFFGKKEEDSDASRDVRAQPAAAPPVLGVSYDPSLIDKLQRDHADLGAIYQSIGDAHACNDHAELRRRLTQFKLRLEAHVLHENVRFYNYVEQSIKSDLTNVELMRGFRRDMNAIVREVLNFVKKYQPANLTPGDYRDFATDYARVQQALELRLDSEENSLYPLYKPH